MRKKIFLLIMVIAMFTSVVSTLFVSSNLNRFKIINADLQQELNNCEYINNRHLEKYVQTLFSENKMIKNVYISNTKSDSIPLGDLITSTKLIYRFYEESCVQCVEDELNIVKQLGDIIGADNICILCDFDKINRLNAMIIRKKIKSPCFIFRERFDLPIENDELFIPAFFLLDENLCTKFVFKSGGHQYFDDPYFQRIITFYKNGN